MKIISRFVKATIPAGKPLQIIFEADEVPEGTLTELMSLDDDSLVTLDVQPEQRMLPFEEERYVN